MNLIKQASTYCNMSSSLSINMPESSISLLPSRTETNFEIFVLLNEANEALIASSNHYFFLTFLCVGVRLDLQNHRSDYVGIHVSERARDPLMTKTTDQLL